MKKPSNPSSPTHFSSTFFTSPPFSLPLLPLHRPATRITSSFPSHSTKPTLQFPFNPQTPTLTHYTTHIRPLTAVEALEKIKKLGTDISNLTLEEARILIDYLQDKLDVSAVALASTATVAIAPGAGEALPSWRRRRSLMWRRRWRKGGWGN
ncbi:50S ribosomal protein L12-1, chloroplastic-like [Pyrus x bretschneideri]|uniref:50S ribosomal protein L12-1, chloroplastic-like n=1 Tax=Pyrus x bretschneideri TaxID=225117 RepID=UPI00202FFA87|nr:50S ribosomal protein L12-1, chloroplastic-like [Pyrus x bretschneideri]